MTTSTTTHTIASALHESGAGWTQPLPSHLDSPSTLVLAFGASRITPTHAVFESLRVAFPNSIISGCSTAGEIAGTRLVDQSLCVGVIRFTKTNVRAAVAPVRSPIDSFRAGALLAEQLAAPDLRCVLVYSDGLNVNGSELVKGLTSRLEPGVTLTGGLAGDGTAFKHTWALHEGQPTPHIVSAVGLYGPSVRVSHGSRGGWDPFGPERRVTRSQASTLYELDGQPALEVYKAAMGPLAKDLPSSGLLFPLAIRTTHESTRVTVRTILGVNEWHDALVFAGDIPEGSIAQMMKADFDRLIGGAAASAASAQATLSNHPCLCVAISCVGRRLVLGERTSDELHAVASGLPEGSAQVGFYSYGEISPLAPGTCDLHNQTMTLTTIREAA